MAFAQNTTVSALKTRDEIERLVNKYGATQFGFATQARRVGITFVAKGRMVRFKLPLPDEQEAEAAYKDLSRHRSKEADWKANWIQDEERRRWRCLLLSIKGKLESSETGIETFEQAFLANIVTTDNLTVYDQIYRAGGQNGMKLLTPKTEE